MRYHNKNQLAITLRLQAEAEQLEEQAAAKLAEASELAFEMLDEFGEKFVMENQAFQIETDRMKTFARVHRSRAIKTIS